MQVFCLVCVCLFYAAVGGCVVYKMSTVTVSTSTGQQVPPVIASIDLPNGQINEADVYALSFNYAWITVAATPHNRQSGTIVNPVITITVDQFGNATLAISSTATWINLPLASVFSLNAQGVPNLTAMGDQSPGIPITLLVSTNLTDWATLATMNVSGQASYIDGDRDFYSGSAFYAVQNQ